jgi:DNA-binding Lrp family transcriptional regulator
MAFIMIRVGAGKYMNWMTTVKEKVEKIPEVVEAYCVFGRYDIIAKVKVKHWKELTNIVGDKIRAIEGVTATETLVAYEE